MPHLKAINLSKSYPNKSALIDCSFSASDGELIGILGANGAGKSTLIKILAGVLKPEAGDAILSGHSIPSRWIASRWVDSCLFFSILKHYPLNM